ncbi:MAG: hypothetical protein ACK5P5_07000 [Pseudobdellovibrionaceae bacterium]|jgi:hypothetical protein
MMLDNQVLDLIRKKSPWIENPDIRPYVFVRPENRIEKFGHRHKLNWFSNNIIVKNPLEIDELEFAEQIYFMEGGAFGPSNMAMPRWVFYDCAVMPGLVAGYAMRTKALPPAIRNVMRHNEACEWTPLSLFIAIPTMHRGEWVAHNLSSVNSLIKDKQDQLYGLGFMSKAFSLWYANMDQCSGMTQWGSPALKLHSYYGHMEIVGAYAPVHSHAKTITYRVEVNTHCWEKFFNREQNLAFLERYEPNGDLVDPKDEQSQIRLHRKIEAGQGPFYLSAAEISEKNLQDPLNIFRLKSNQEI